MGGLNVSRRHLEQFRRLFLYRLHPAPVLHQRRPLLRHLSAAHVPDENHPKESGRHVGQHLDLAGAHLLLTHISRMVIQFHFQKSFIFYFSHFIFLFIDNNFDAARK